MDKYAWLIFAALAGLCWGTYVPFVQQGIRGLGSPFGSFLCVGLAYFLIAVLVPIVLLSTLVGTRRVMKPPISVRHFTTRASAVPCSICFRSPQ